MCMMCKSCGRDIDKSLGYCTFCEGNHDENNKKKTEKGYKDYKSDYKLDEKIEDCEKKEKSEGYEYIKCKKCGNFVSNEMSFCPYCGVYLKESGNSLFKRLKNKFVSYTSRDVEREDSLILFIESCLCLGFFLLGLFSVYSLLISGIDIILYVYHARLLELFFRVIYFIGSFILLCVSLRGYREIKKLVQEAKESDSSFRTLLYIFMGGFVFFGMMVSSFLG